MHKLIPCLGGADCHIAECKSAVIPWERIKIMISDVVCERIVEKKREKSEMIKSTLIVAAAAVLVIICALFILFMPGTFALAVVVMIGVVYFAIKLLGNLNVEYEYCFVNGELTVDKILNKSVRKEQMTLQVKNVDKAGYYTSGMDIQGNVLNYSDSDDPEGAVYFQFRDVTGRVNVAIMNLDEDFLAKMKPHFNQLVYREAFKK